MTNPFKIDATKLTPALRQQRANVRNAYYPATKDELQAGFALFNERDNTFAAKCVMEIMMED